MKLSRKPSHYAPRKRKGICNANTPGHKSHGGRKVFGERQDVFSFILSLFTRKLKGDR